MTTETPDGELLALIQEYRPRVFEIVQLKTNAWTDLGPGPARLYAGEDEIFYATGDRAPADLSTGKVRGRRCFFSLETSNHIWVRTGSALRPSAHREGGHHIFVLAFGAILPGEKVPLDLNGRHTVSAEEIFSAIFSAPGRGALPGRNSSEAAQ
jgi:hypothetical protein